MLQSVTNVARTVARMATRMNRLGGPSATGVPTVNGVGSGGVEARGRGERFPSPEFSQRRASSEVTMTIVNLTQKELVVIIRALAFYGHDLEINGVSKTAIMGLLTEFSHALEEDED